MKKYTLSFEPYDTQIRVIVATPEEARKYHKKSAFSEIDYEYEAGGATLVVDGFWPLIFLNSNLNKKQRLQTFAHECVHVINREFGRVGIDLDHNNDESDELKLTGYSAGMLQEAAKWAKIVSVLLYINSFYMIYQFIVMIAASRTAYDRNEMQLGTGLTSVLLIIFTFFAAFHLWSFANRTILSLKTKKDKTFAIAIDSLKSYLKFYGFFTIVLAIMVALTLYNLWRALRFLTAF